MMCERTENFQDFIFYDSIHMMGIIHDSKFSIVIFQYHGTVDSTTMGHMNYPHFRAGTKLFFGNKYSVVQIMHVIELTNFK